MTKCFLNPVVEEHIDEEYHPICSNCSTSTINYGIIDENTPPCFAYCTSCGANAEGNTLNEVFNKLDVLE